MLQVAASNQKLLSTISRVTQTQEGIEAALAARCLPDTQVDTQVDSMPLASRKESLSH